MHYQHCSVKIITRSDNKCQPQTYLKQGLGGGDIMSWPTLVGSSKFQRRSSQMGNQGTSHVDPCEDQQSFGHNWVISSQELILGYNLDKEL